MQNIVCITSKTNAAGKYQCKTQFASLAKPMLGKYQCRKQFASLVKLMPAGKYQYKTEQ